MLDAEIFQSILGELENNGAKFKSILDKIIRISIGVVQNTEELREEIVDYEEIFQTYVKDIDMEYWIKVADGNITYGQGDNEEASVKVWLTKDMILQILKGDIMGAEAYMKGALRAHGSLTQGLKYIKLYRLFFEYMKEKHQLKRYPG